MERKVGVEDFNDKMEQKSDKINVVNLLNGKANKSEVEGIMGQKAEIKEVDRLLMTLESKFESEF